MAVFCWKNYSRRDSQEALSRKAGYIPGTIIIHISEDTVKSAPHSTAAFSLPIPKSSSTPDKTLIRTSQDEIMQNLEAQRGHDPAFQRKYIRKGVRCLRGGGTSRGPGLRPRNISWSPLWICAVAVDPILRTLSVDPI